MLYMLVSILIMGGFLLMDSCGIWGLYSIFQRLNPTFPYLSYWSIFCLVVIFKLLDGSLFEYFVEDDDEEEEE